MIDMNGIFYEKFQIIIKMPHFLFYSDLKRIFISPKVIVWRVFIMTPFKRIFGEKHCE